MVRISSLGQQQLLLNNIFGNQNRVANVQEQITTRKIANEYRELAGQTDTLLASKSFQSRTSTYQETITNVQGRVDATGVQVGGIIEVLDTYKEAIDTAVANNQAAGLSELADTTFSFLVNALNTNFDGSFLFSGVSAGEEPVNVGSLPELVALTGNNGTTLTANDVAAAFDNADTELQARIADGVDVDFGLLADDVGAEIFATLHNIFNYDANVEELDGELSVPQREFLTTQIQELDRVIENIRQQDVRNGLTFERLDVVSEQHEDTNIFLQSFITDIEDVDLAEAITRLNNDQFALEASYQSLATLNDLSLLRFL